jgi:hypothetical protein
MGSGTIGRTALIGLAWLGVIVCGLMAVWTGWLLVRAALDTFAGRATPESARWLTALFLFVPSVFGLAISRVLLRMVRGHIPPA